MNHNRYAEPGKAGSVGIFGTFLSAFEDFRVEVDDVIDAASAWWSGRLPYRGRHTGTFMGIPPSGAPIEMHSIDIWRIHDGLLHQHWDELNNLEFFQQLGALPAAQLTRHRIRNPRHERSPCRRSASRSPRSPRSPPPSCTAPTCSPRSSSAQALAALDDVSLVQAAGRIHQYADQRMPIPGAAGTLAAGAATLTATLAGNLLQAGLAAERWSRCWPG